jgi:hypothetical protein
MEVKLIVFFDRRNRILNKLLERCVESKLRSTNEKNGFLTLKVQTFQNRDQDPKMKSFLECFFISNEMQLLKISRKNPKRNFGFITLFFYKNNLSY